VSESEAILNGWDSDDSEGFGITPLPLKSLVFSYQNYLPAGVSEFPDCGIFLQQKNGCQPAKVFQTGPESSGFGATVKVHYFCSTFKNNFYETFSSVDASVDALIHSDHFM
jgi:hypothetical protein